LPAACEVLAERCGLHRRLVEHQSRGRMQASALLEGDESIGCNNVPTKPGGVCVAPIQVTPVSVDTWRDPQGLGDLAKIARLANAITRHFSKEFADFHL
jgi:hypothetical protein